MGVVYETPARVDPASPETALTPYEVNNMVDEVMTISSGSDSDEWESDAEIDGTSMSLIWNGNTRSDVHNMFLSAKQHIRSGNSEQAELLLRRAVQGYGHLVGPTHEDTNAVVATLATLYFESDRLADAYKVIEQSCRVHIEKAGIHDRRAQQHITDMIQLLHGWNREDDALAFLARAQEIATASHNGSAKRDTRRKPRARAKDIHDSRGSLLHEASRDMNENSHSTQLDYGLGLVSTLAPSEGEAAEQLLRLTIERCALNTDKLAIQRLRAWSELLKLLNKSGRARAQPIDFDNAHSAFHHVVQGFPWNEATRERFKPILLMEIALELAARFVAAGQTIRARAMFQTCEETASKVFGEYDERTLWSLISIGLVYQRYRDWNDAFPWFEHALATAMELYDENDGIRISLEEAMEVRHFSYISDEGRPYKTIFGVNGLKISPTRLHMD
jgi:tetratricopeptide (TPR) repeat protein